MSERPLKLMLVDEDPTFRLGLRVWLEQMPGFQVVAEASTAEQTLGKLRSQAQAVAAAFAAPTLKAAALRPIDLVILDMGLGQGTPEQMPGLRLCAAIKTEFPQLPVLVLSANPEPVLEAAARQLGADGYGSRGMPVRQLAQLIRDVAQQPVSVINALPMTAAPPTPRAPIPGPFTAMRLSMRLSGLQQIDQALAAVQTEQPFSDSWLDRQVLAGRARELKAARWLVARLWATPQFGEAPWSQARAIPSIAAWPSRRSNAAEARPNPPPLDSKARTAAGTLARNPVGTSSKPPTNSAINGAGESPAGSPMTDLGGNLTPIGETQLQSAPRELQSVIFEAVFARLQVNLENISEIPLEIDILRTEKKRELFYIILRRLEDLLDNLRQSPLQPGQLAEKSPQILRDLWNGVLEDFFGKYYTVRVNNIEQEVITVLQQEQPIIESEILAEIPLVPELFAHWLFQESLYIDGSPYLATTPEALRHSQKLLENLLIQMANAIIQPLLNRLADVEAIKKSFYSRRLISSREIERFRNNLAWRYRWDRWVNEPKSIFESEYRLFALTLRGIDRIAIYAPRRDQLETLSGMQWALTMALETRDAIAPRVQAIVSLVGSGFVYVLTELVGRGIGLIGRGILQGVGSAWQDTRRNKRRQQPDKGFNEWE